MSLSPALPIAPRLRRQATDAARLAPIRDEVFGLERLTEHGRAWAEQDRILPTTPRGARLLPRLAENERVLLAARRQFSLSGNGMQSLPPAAEWLLDNFYIVQDQLREIKQDLTHGYYAELPKAANRHGTGYPRVYGIALELIAHGDSRLDADALACFVKAYQTAAPLTLGELWAIAIMLRLGLIENLRRLVHLSLVSQQQRDAAALWAKRVAGAARRPIPALNEALVELARDETMRDPDASIYLLQLLRDADPALLPVIRWIEERLHADGWSVDDAVHGEHMRRAADRVSVANIITSMRALTAMDWQTFVESTSLVESTLREDPAGIYTQMDFATRDMYRHAVERIAKRSNRGASVAANEQTVARLALEMARQSEGSERDRHVGHYLIGRGRAGLEAAAGYRPTARARATRLVLDHATPFYVGLVVLAMAILLFIPFAYAATAFGQAPDRALALLVLAVSLIPSSAVAVAAVNQMLSVELETTPLPKLEFKDGLPAGCRTLVAVPVLISRMVDVQHLFDNLEIRSLANRDKHLHFALLGDFADADEPERPEDAALLAAAIHTTQELNARHRTEGQAGDRFYYFHRRRTWNESEQVWMGWERKRGKLSELNRLLRGATDTTYIVQEGDPSILPDVKYVITLDADTELPLNSARQLVGTLAHPLNRAVIDPVTCRVREGYGIIQPRAAITALSAAASRFAQIFAGDTGLDPYSTASSDVYQDLFGAGIYVGKAIYDVDTFHKVLNGRFPQNLLLSHDLLEGAYVRTGLATDIQVLEDYPSGYDAYSQREHRWIRGDWQITDWLFPSVANGRQERERNPLPLVERFKIFDNLRRSLVPTAIVLFLVAGWTILPGSPLVWTALGLVPLVLTPGVAFLSQLGVHPVGESWRAYLTVLKDEAFLNAARACLYISFLPHQAVVGVDAVSRVLVRRAVTRRHLLQWNSAADIQRGQARTVADYLLSMWAPPVLATLLVPLLLWTNPGAMLAAAPLLVSWWMAPVLAYATSRPLRGGAAPLPAEAYRPLRLIARKTWRFYETFAGAADHYLPPDNFQVEPLPNVTARTSPTNIGFLLLSTVAAYDFGYLELCGLADRLERTLATLHTLECYRGHFYNWYDTRTLRPLHPQYVSTVDSGNLAASLLVVKQACLELANAPVLSPALWQGAQDTIAALDDVLTGLTSEDPRQARNFERMRAIVVERDLQGRPVPAGIRDWRERLDEIDAFCSALDEPRGELERHAGPTRAAVLVEIAYWCNELLQLTAAGRAILDSFAPWSANGAAASPALDSVPTLEELARGWIGKAPTGQADDPPAVAEELRTQARQAADQLRARLHALAWQAGTLVTEMDFRFLLDPQRDVFSVGFNRDTYRLDNSFYDLLASEARLTSFLAVALGQAPARHWFKLGRTLTHTVGQTALLSWGGTMFEYLMPSLWMRTYERTLLHQTARVAVRRQIEYGKQHGVPWGMSESGYNAVDYQQNYQYRMFGVPDLALKREPSPDLVVAPYATFLALPFEPQAAWDNLRQLAREGAVGDYGYCEAIDYTPSRRPKGHRFGIVRSYMAHHQGMSLCALDNALNGDALQRRFHAEAIVSATELLLQEKLPRHAPVIEPQAPVTPASPALADAVTPVLATANTSAPRTHLLSNGAYTVMLTNAGGGYSAYKGTELTRWRSDTTCDSWGSFIYVRDTGRNALWSATYQPVGRESEMYEVVFSLDKVSYRRHGAGIETLTEIAVSPEHNVEVRRIRLTNETRRARVVQLTSYAEVALAAHRADAAHPAFSKLFVESEYLPERSALLFQRRARGAGQPPVWALHLLMTEGQMFHNVECETDRARFLGRGRTPRDAAALHGPLSNTVGAVLDPIMSLRGTLRLEPGGQATLAFVTGIAESREEALRLVDAYRDPRAIARAFDLSEASNQVLLRHLVIGKDEAQVFQRLASHVMYPEPALRAAPGVLARNNQGQTGLYPYGLSGDYPIVLVKLDDSSGLPLVRQALLAHEYWRMHNFAVDLVILNEHTTTYGEGLHEAIQSMIDTSLSHLWVDKPGGIFLRRADYVTPEGRILLETAARVVLQGARGSIAEQLDRSGRLALAAALDEHVSPPNALPRWKPPSFERRKETVEEQPRRSEGASRRRLILGGMRVPAPASPPTVPARPPLLFDNGLGGFDSGQGEYVIVLDKGRWTPTPWSNVLANEGFGALVSESGLGCTWAGNSQLNRLTPWSNDPASDPPGEAIYVRDDGSGDLSSPTPLPIREESPYVVQHGTGYTRYTHRSHKIFQELLVFVPADDPVKVLRLKLRNEAKEVCALSVTGYCEWVLGTLREQSQHYVVSEYVGELGALFARNTYNTDFRERVAFAAVATEVDAALGTAPSFTADRAEFIGRNGSLQMPAGLRRRLSGRAGAGLDPCAALQVQIRLRPQQETEITFLIGQGKDDGEARALIQKYRMAGQVRTSFETVRAHWDALCRTVQVKTPDPAMDIMLNRWLLYQAMACRVFGRTAFYQSGGAYGFRDQLQDVMALVFAAPELARAHILRAAAHQFAEGDALHWWHPPGGGGIRSRCSDDYLWLPYVVDHYVTATGDAGILDTPVPFLEAPALAPNQEETYLAFAPEGAPDTLYAHCTRALDRALALFGAHDLPLMGSGDWNDGMNNVGVGGKGESVWLGWFLHANLTAFGALAERRGDETHAREYAERAARLRHALEEHGWDGEWYRRAYFDDGTPLGSAQNDECRIDSVAQSWATISRAAQPERAAQALQSAEKHLVDEENGIIRLLTPPFDQGTLAPGYIRGYVPGIRENGAQYTHAALWLTLAHALQGNGDRAAQLFAMLNPVNHALTPEAVARYKVEPYVIAADVYSHPQHAGRGGWTWYTGSAAWMYRIGLENILGLKRRGDALSIEPCIPRAWKQYQIAYRFGAATYVIDVENPGGANGGVSRITVDGKEQGATAVRLVDDGETHRVTVILGKP